MAAKEAAHTGVRRHRSTLLMAQQVDDQHIRLGHERLECRDRFSSETFICIKHEHPVACDELQGDIASWSEIAWPRQLFDPCPCRLCNGDGVVGRACVNDDHFVGEGFDGVQAGSQPLLLVSHDH